MRAAVHDLMDARPRRHDAREFHPIVERIHDELRNDWIEEGAARLREEGHVFTGEVLVVPKTEDHLVDRLEQLANQLLSLEWKVYDIVVVPVREIDVPSPGAPARRDGVRGSGGDRGGAERTPAGSR